MFDLPALHAGLFVQCHQIPYVGAMTGDDQPDPGTATFQATFSVSLQVSGRPRAVEFPCPSGPRNCGHDPAIAIWQTTTDEQRVNPQTLRNAVRKTVPQDLG